MADSSDERPLSKCGACGKTDNAPKLQTLVGSAEVGGERVYHPHDFDRNGVIFAHMDCPSPYHEQGGEAHMAIVAACLGGLQNDELHAHIMGLVAPVGGE